MTDIVKFQQLLDSVNCDFTARRCADDHGWHSDEGVEHIKDINYPYITLEIDDATDINIIFDNLGKFIRFTHHG